MGLDAEPPIPLNQSLFNDEHPRHHPAQDPTSSPQVRRAACPIHQGLRDHRLIFSLHIANHESMTATQLTTTEFCAALPSDVLINAVDSLGEQLLATGSEVYYFDKICLAFDTIVAELTARGLWVGSDS